MKNRDNKDRKIKNTYFFVNKIYLLLIFIWVSLQSISLGVYYFLISLFAFIWKVFTSKVPMEVKGDFIKKTYVYKKTPDRDLKLDVWSLSSSKIDEMPLVYFCHGGGWISGFRNQPNNISWCKFLASKGFIVVSIDYRYGFKNSMEDILADYTDGLKFLKNNNNKLRLNIDLSKITLMGLSAGAHLSLLYSSYYSYLGENNFLDGVKSVVAYYPPSDLKDLLDPGNKSLFARFAARKTLGGSPEELNEVYDFYSPINYISKDMLPCFIAHGKKDTTVPFRSSIKFVQKLKNCKVPYEFLVHKNADHSFDTSLRDHRTINIINQTVGFIKKYGR